MNFRLSKFNYIIHQYPRDTMVLIFNTLQRSLLAVPKEIFKYMNNKQFEKIPEEIMCYLRNTGMILNKEIDEANLFEYRLDTYRVSKNVVGITLLPTYTCNCKCVYCYADGVKDPIFMSPPVRKHFLKWVESLISTQEPKELDFSLHGGEPLIAWDFLEEIMRGVNNITDRYSLNKNFSVVTNGTLLSEEKIKKLIEYSVHRALFTIDGPPEIHNQRRMYKSGRETFKIIFNNMVKALDSGMHIVLGVNVDRHNWQYIPKFLDFLAKEEFPQRRNFNIIFGMVRRGPTPHNPDYFSRYEANPEESAQIMYKLYREALQRKLRIVEPIGLGVCTFKTGAYLIVDPLGKIYKCITLTGRNEAYVGDIFQDLETIMQNITKFMYLEPWKYDNDCKNCVYLPLCSGGCAQQALLKYHTINKVDCIRDYIDIFLPEALKIAHKRMETFPELQNHLQENIKELFGF